MRESRILVSLEVSLFGDLMVADVEDLGVAQREVECRDDESIHLWDVLLKEVMVKPLIKVNMERKMNNPNPIVLELLLVGKV